MTKKYLVVVDAVGIPGPVPELPPVPVTPPAPMPTYAYRNDVIELPDNVAKELVGHGVIKPVGELSDEEKAAAKAKEQQAEVERARVQQEEQQEAEQAAKVLAAQQAADDAAAAVDPGGEQPVEVTEEEQAAAREELAKAQAAGTPTAKQKLLLEAEDMGLELTGTSAQLQARIDEEKKARGDDGSGD